MSTNLSKQKRDDLLFKIFTIRAYISTVPQDKNTGSLLIYLSDLEKDVNGKEYGLIFEEHQKATDTVLVKHTLVLTEETGLLIDNGSKMNFLLEGDKIANLNDISTRTPLNTHVHSREYHHHMAEIVLKVRLEYTQINTILRRLLDKNMRYANKLLSLETREDINIFSPRKFEVLENYLTKYELRGGFVRADKQSQELCICMDMYNEDIKGKYWALLDNVMEVVL